MSEFFIDFFSTFTLKEMLGLLALILFAVLSLVGNHYSYLNGINDGYGYAREPTNPGYKRAREYLIKHCAWRWPELKELDTPWRLDPHFAANGFSVGLSSENSLEKPISTTSKLKED